MIGNDLICRKKWKKSFSRNMERKITRLFSEEEKENIEASRNQILMTAIYWSMKESTYKCINRERRERVYSPISFECHLNKNNSGYVIYEKIKYDCKIDVFDNYIHTKTVKNENLKMDELILEISEKSYDLREKQAKSRFTQWIADQLNACSFQVEITKERTVPFYLLDKKKFPLSISHDGNYYAFYYPINL